MPSSNRSSNASNVPASAQSELTALRWSWEQSRTTGRGRSTSMASMSSGRAPTSHSGHSDPFDLEAAATFQPTATAQQSSGGSAAAGAASGRDPRDSYGPQGLLGVRQEAEDPPPRYNRLSHGPPDYASRPSSMTLPADTVSTDTSTGGFSSIRRLPSARSRRSAISSTNASNPAPTERPPSYRENPNSAAS
ncbi:hypothetical protein IAU59_005252 [Kwoniella sp. CBS 9459]